MRCCRQNVLTMLIPSPLIIEIRMELSVWSGVGRPRVGNVGESPKGQCMVSQRRVEASGKSVDGYGEAYTGFTGYDGYSTLPMSLQCCYRIQCTVPDPIIARRSHFRSPLTPRQQEYLRQALLDMDTWLIDTTHLWQRRKTRIVA
jgi:hypothetical protein